MKTIEQVLEGVTAGGKWKADHCGLTSEVGLIADFEHVKTDAAYAARACSEFPALVRLATSVVAHGRDVLHFGTCCCQRCELWWQAQAALTVALKDQTFFQTNKT